MSDARMHAQFVDGAAVWGGRVFYHRPEVAQDPSRFGQRAGLGRGDPGERVVGLTPDGEVEGERQEVGVHDFRRTGGGEAPMRRVGPETEGGAGAEASRASGALIRVVARDAHGAQSGQAETGIEPRHAGEAAVDHHRHSFNGETRFRDIRGQNHSPPRPGHDRRLLCLNREIAMQRPDVEPVRGGQVLQTGRDAGDLGSARQEGEDIALGGAQRPSDGGPDRGHGIAVRADVIGGVGDFDRERSPGAGDHRRSAQGP
jgi:hypothetical protein